MIMVDEKKNRIRLDIEVSEDSLVGFRSLLFENGLSVQEFLAFLFISAEMKEQNIVQLIELAKIRKINNNEKVVINHKPSSSNALYNLLEQRSPLKQQR